MFTTTIVLLILALLAAVIDSARNLFAGPSGAEVARRAEWTAHRRRIRRRIWISIRPLRPGETD